MDGVIRGNHVIGKKDLKSEIQIRLNSVSCV